MWDQSLNIMDIGKNNKKDVFRVSQDDEEQKVQVPQLLMVPKPKATPVMDNKREKEENDVEADLRKI